MLFSRMPKSKKSDPLLLDKLAAVLFTIIAVLHAWRILYQWQVRIELFAVPFSWSMIAVLVAGMMALTFWKRVRKSSS